MTGAWILLFLWLNPRKTANGKGILPTSHWDCMPEYQYSTGSGGKIGQETLSGSWSWRSLLRCSKNRWVNYDCIMVVRGKMQQQFSWTPCMTVLLRGWTRSDLSSWLLSSAICSRHSKCYSVFKIYAGMTRDFRCCLFYSFYIHLFYWHWEDHYDSSTIYGSWKPDTPDSWTLSKKIAKRDWECS